MTNKAPPAALIARITPPWLLIPDLRFLLLQQQIMSTMAITVTSTLDSLVFNVFASAAVAIQQALITKVSIRLVFLALPEVMILSLIHISEPTRQAEISYA